MSVNIATPHINYKFKLTISNIFIYILYFINTSYQCTVKPVLKKINKWKLAIHIRHWWIVKSENKYRTVQSVCLLLNNEYNQVVINLRKVTSRTLSLSPSFTHSSFTHIHGKTQTHIHKEKSSYLLVAFMPVVVSAPLFSSNTTRQQKPNHLKKGH